MNYTAANTLTKNTTGSRYYELANHLGNVLSVVSDRRTPIYTVINTTTTITGYKADIVSATDYYPFGMSMSERSFSSPNYRYGFNGKEKDDEVKGSGNSYDFGARLLDVRLGRWLAVDPLTKEYTPISCYVFSLNNPIIFMDKEGSFVVGIDGNPVYYTKGKDGQIIWSPNATKDVKRIGNAMLKTVTGTRVFEAMQATSYSIKLNISKEFNPKKLGFTSKIWDSEAKVKSVVITIYEGNLINYKNDFLVSNCTGSSLQTNLYEASIRMSGGIEEAIGAVAAHEGIHATDPKNLRQSFSNIVKGTNYDLETKPESIENDFLIEATIPLVKVEPKTISSIPVPNNIPEKIEKK